MRKRKMPTVRMILFCICWIAATILLILHKTTPHVSVHPGSVTPNHIFRYNYTTYLKQHNEAIPRNKSILIGVFSTAANVQRREAGNWTSECSLSNPTTARNTWMKDLKKANSAGVDVKLYFVLGKPKPHNEEGIRIMIQTEQEKYKDILILEDGVDEYKMLAHKLLAFYRWASTQEVQYDYVMKMDDDSYLNIPMFVDTLKRLPKERMHYGYFWYNVPKEKADSKYYDSKYNLGAYYPPYAAGPGHVMSMDLIHFISELEYPLIIQNDDVNADIWIYGLDVMRIHDDRVHGGYQLCCGVKRSDRTDFILIVNTTPKTAAQIYEFMHSEQLTFDQYLNYYDCDCNQPPMSHTLKQCATILYIVGAIIGSWKLWKQLLRILLNTINRLFISSNTLRL